MRYYRLDPAVPDYNHWARAMADHGCLAAVSDSEPPHWSSGETGLRSLCAGCSPYREFWSPPGELILVWSE